MSIRFSCNDCGKAFSVNDDLAGRRAKCKCGSILTVPEPIVSDEPADLYDFVEPPPPINAPVPAYAVASESDITAPTAAKIKAPPGAVRRIGYALLILTLIPLAWDTFTSVPFNLKDALAQTVKHHPETSGRLASALSAEKPTTASIFAALPDHRVDGAWLPYDTEQHWLYACLASVVFIGLVTLPFPGATQSYPKLVAIGAFTATAGICLLLAVQWIALHTQGVFFTGGSIVVILFYIVKFIGLSYRMALDPNTSFLLSALGFTFGVGMCEEICKALPVLVHYESSSAGWPWRTACVVGLVSGVGFGVSEGVTYCHDYYNGMMGGDIYLVRFISCVALHAVWTGATAIFVCRQQAHLGEASEGLLSKLLWWAILVTPSMVLHGFYDTLLKKQYNGWALVVAALSFAWLFLQIEWADRADRDDAAYETRRSRIHAPAA